MRIPSLFKVLTIYLIEKWLAFVGVQEIAMHMGIRCKII